jgi:hypothetical protein
MKTLASAIESNIQHSTFKILTSTYPGLTKEMLDYEIQVIRKFVKAKPCQKLHNEKPDQH